jgi:hypothetical protein
MVRGCYFASIGPGGDDYAFVSGLSRGTHSKMIGDAPLTSWAREAGDYDRRYRLMALALGLAAAALALPVWLLSIVPRLSTPTPGSPRGVGWLGWAGLGSLALVWVGGLVYWRTRGRRAPRTAS